MKSLNLALIRVRQLIQNISRADAADSFRLATLLKRYDQRVTTANKSEWLGSFTCRGVGGGARGCVRRDWSLPLPRPHLEALMSLPLQLQLDVAVMLAVQATFRNSIPQQVWNFRSLFHGILGCAWRAAHTFSAEVLRCWGTPNCFGVGLI